MLGCPPRGSIFGAATLGRVRLPLIAIVALTAGITAAPLAAAPTLSGLIAPRTTKAPQGHAQLLVGVKLSEPAKLQVQLTTGTDARVVQSVTTRADHPAGRAYVLVPAVDASGFQLTAGDYAVSVEAISPTGEHSKALRAPATIQLDAPLGRLDALTVPLLPPFARQLRIDPGGQLVAVVAPGGPAATAGLRRGDVIVAVNGKSTGTQGAFRVALSTTPAATPVAIDVRRGAQTLNLSVTLQPDWTAPIDFTTALTVANRRAKGFLFLQYAAVRNQIGLGRPDAAAKLLATWKPAVRRGVVGQLLTGDIALARADGRNALVAYQRAAQRDPQLAQAALGIGLANTLVGDLGGAVDALTRAGALDPSDAEATATRALALLRLDRTADALSTATLALQIDPTSANAKIAQGIAQITNGTIVDGLTVLRQGITETADASRAQSVIQKNLEPNDP